MTRKKILKAAAGLTMALGATALPVDTADAHIFDGWSHFYCAKHRQNTAFAIKHAVPIELQPNYVAYWCQEDFFGVRFYYRVYVDMPLESNNSSVPLGRAKCYPAAGWTAICTEPG